jgi:ssRNA-specific RNase YbeY (16S rRNA maturation enzyme)
MKFQVQIHHSDQTEAIDASRLTEAIRMMALDVGIEQGRISIAILSDPEMRELNRQYLDHDYETDVISFNLSDDDDFLDGELLLGADTARPEQRDEMRVQERHYLQALQVNGWERHPTHGEAHSDSNSGGSSEETEL